MGVKLMLSMVCIAILVCGACNNDEVDSKYSVEIENLKAIVGDQQGNTSDRYDIFLDSLRKQEFIGNIEVSGESRAENDKMAEAKFEEKCKSIQKMVLRDIFEMAPEESAEVQFDYILFRGKKELAREKMELKVPGIFVPIQ